ncbi:hypothetical protein BKA62DRAFT_686615, partial [Auriculariales sp. MPI-PUGE-AT-0066]
MPPSAGSVASCIASLRPAATRKTLHRSLDVVLSITSIDEDASLDDCRRIGTALMSDLNELYKSCPKQTLNLAVAVFTHCFERLVLPGLHHNQPTDKFEPILRGVLGGVAEYIKDRQGDCDLVAHMLFKHVLALLEAPNASKLGRSLLRDAALFFEDICGESNDYHLLVESNLFNAARFGKLLVHHKYFFCLQALLDLLPHILPARKDKKRREDFIKRMLNSASTRVLLSDTERKAMIPHLVKVAADDWPKTVQKFFAAMAGADASKPQPFEVSEISIQGHSLGCGLGNVMYFDQFGFVTTVFSSQLSQGQLEDLEIPYVSILPGSVLLASTSREDLTYVTIKLKSPPALSQEPMKLPGAAPFHLCLKLVPDASKRLCHLLNQNNLSFTDNSSGHAGSSQSRTRFSLSQGVGPFEAPIITTSELEAKKIAQLQSVTVSSSPAHLATNRLETSSPENIKNAVAARSISTRAAASTLTSNLTSPSASKRTNVHPLGADFTLPALSEPEGKLPQHQDTTAVPHHIEPRDHALLTPSPTSNVAPKKRKADDDPVTSRNRTAKRACQERVVAPDSDSSIDGTSETAAGKENKFTHDYSTYNSQFLLRSSSPAKNTYKSKAKMRQATTSPEPSRVVSVDFDAVPSAPAVAGKKTAKATKKLTTAKATRSRVKAARPRDAKKGLAKQAEKATVTRGEVVQSMAAKQLGASEGSDFRPSDETLDKINVQPPTQPPRRTRARAAAVGPSLTEPALPEHDLSKELLRSSRPQSDVLSSPQQQPQPELCSDVTRDPYDSGRNLHPRSLLPTPPVLQDSAANVTHMLTSPELPKDVSLLSDIDPMQTELTKDNGALEQAIAEDFEKFINCSPPGAPSSTVSLPHVTLPSKQPLSALRAPKVVSRKPRKAPWDALQYAPSETGTSEHDIPSVVTSTSVESHSAAPALAALASNRDSSSPSITPVALPRSRSSRTSNFPTATPSKPSLLCTAAKDLCSANDIAAHSKFSSPHAHEKLLTSAPTSPDKSTNFQATEAAWIPPVTETLTKLTKLRKPVASPVLQPCSKASTVHPEDTRLPQVDRINDTPQQPPTTTSPLGKMKLASALKSPHTITKLAARTVKFAPEAIQPSPLMQSTTTHHSLLSPLRLLHVERARRWSYSSFQI